MNGVEILGIVGSLRAGSFNRLALKAAQESTAKVATGQFVRLSDRLDRAERAQAEPAGRLARS